MAAQGKYDEAKPNLERVVAILEKALGAEHPDVAMGLSNLGSLLHGKFIIDLVFLSDVRSWVNMCVCCWYGKSFSLVDDNVSHLRVVVTLTDMHKLHEAMPYMKRAWELRRRLFGDTDPCTAALLRELLSLNRTLRRGAEPPAAS